MSEKFSGTRTSTPIDSTAATSTPPTTRVPSAAEQQWEKTVLQPTLDKFGERTAEFTTISAYPIRRLYTQADLANENIEQEIGLPGEPPYTRGIHPTMYRGRLWTMRQFAGFGTAEDTNQRFRYLLAQGQNGLSVAFDLPTLMGYDSDHLLSEGEVGKCGVAISSLADMEVLFDQDSARERHHLHDHQFPGRRHLGDVSGRGRKTRRGLEKLSAARCRTTS